MFLTYLKDEKYTKSCQNININGTKTYQHICYQMFQSLFGDIFQYSNTANWIFGFPVGVYTFITLLWKLLAFHVIKNMSD